MSNGETPKSDVAVHLTHPDRVVFSAGYTKQDVADYYAAVMPRLLLAIRNRPLSIIRCPSGTDKGCFFQKHAMPGLKRVRSVVLKEESGGEDTYLYVEKASQLLELVQFNAIEFHPWASTIKNTNVTDYLVFDLDPGPDVAWKSVIGAAKLLRDRLLDLKLESFPRTSGGKGLHVVVPLRPAVAWADAKQFAHAFAAALADERPHEFVATASKAKRDGVIFIDYLRNSRGATSVASYSLRSRPGAPVALPLSWDGLRKVKSASAFTLRNVPSAIKRQTRDPWAEFGTVRQSLPPKKKYKRAASSKIMMPAFVISGVTMATQIKTETKQNSSELGELQLDLGGLVRHLAHEIANPLNAVMMNAEMARSLVDRGDVTRASEILERLLGDCARCGKLMRNMQNFGGSLCEHDPVSLSVAELVEGATSTIVFEYEGSLPTFDVDVKGFTVNVDRAAMERALIALLRNAGEAGATQVSIVASKNENKVCIDIRDDGVGLDEKGIQKLSGFYSTKRADGGMGLGIAMAREIVRKNGGALSVRANSPKGLHISIGLPAASA